ncbi:HTH-type transcriptional regulator RafR [Shimia sp. SK013]|uniref:LacI family DNA-binding transcriptional regulator n=1 Tax=Shimia sp. SK013 TaxID=1389006 RepID=UPI0006B656AA|nr:LacI family DNA-binding transcriptional regulator [Shimia sp. SK013]KPA20995.1 HTH-type transcriptional regulator RafR [Shimia sp. SK013]
MNRRIDQQEGTSVRSRVTISDVSDALGLTKSTVSRALNNYSDISESTRLRVQRMSEKMGYQPLSYAQAIRTGRTKSLGLVVQLSDHDAHRPFLAAFLAGLSQGASDEGWTMTIATADSPEATIDTIKTLIKDRKADGFILPRTLRHDPRVTVLRDADVPFVLYGRCHDPAGCAWHDILGEDAMRDAVRHLVKLGHVRIGFINGGVQYNYSALRLEGFLAGMKEAGLTTDPAHVKSDAMSIEGGEAASLVMLSTDTPPTAIVCAVDMAALGVYRTAADLGLTIGADLSLIGYDGIPEGGMVTPQLTTFAVDHTASGRRLSNLLIRRIGGEDIETLRELVPATLQERGSTGPPLLTSTELTARIALLD